MNVLTRGVKNTLRSPIRSGAIVLMFAISIALILSMLVARSSVQTKINEVKATAGTAITIRPAGVMGAMGGGDPLTTEQLNTITSTAHITSTTLTLTDQVATDSTSLESSLELGAFGRRAQEGSSDTANSTLATPPAMTPRITATGTNDVNSVSTNGSDLTISSGESIDATSTDNVALVGKGLAEKNSLSAGDTFTLYDTSFTVKGIYETGNTFQDSGLIVPLKTLQTITDQEDAVNTILATVDSSDNVSSTVSALESALGDNADITSEVERAESSVSSLESIASLALTGVIAASLAAAAIILLAMIMVVRERRREIGVMKAIGGTDGKVVGQFIFEGLTLTVFGAIIGLALGVVASGPMTTSLVSSQSSSSTTARPGIASNGQVGQGGPGGMMRGGFDQLQTNAAQVSASLTPEIISVAAGVTLLIALVGTAIPAWLTARVRPAEVLRSE